MPRCNISIFGFFLKKKKTVIEQNYLSTYKLDYFIDILGEISLYGLKLDNFSFHPMNFLRIIELIKMFSCFCISTFENICIYENV